LQIFEFAEMDASLIENTSEMDAIGFRNNVSTLVLFRTSEIACLGITLQLDRGEPRLGAER